MNSNNWDCRPYLQRIVSLFSRHQRPVLIIGERGTGKEEVASRLHYLSSRWSHTLVKLNCAAFNDELLDSELFGHEAGAFTGARSGRTGLFEKADGGTLFLDELATMGPRLQEKLLRVVEYGEFYRIGSSRVVKVDVRIIAATNENLLELADQGRFRKDLLDRLAFDVLAIPPLRVRQDDIIQLANHFAFRMAQALASPKEDAVFFGFSDRAVEEMINYSWPGNIRELKNAVERSVCHNQSDDVIDSIILNPFHSPWLADLGSSKADHQADNIKKRKPEASSSLIEKQVQLLKQGCNIELKEVLAEVEQLLLRSSMEAGEFNQKQAVFVNIVVAST